MRSFCRNLTLVFGAGCLGGLVKSLVVWLFGEAGITAALNVNIAPSLTPSFLYRPIVWGGIWAILFLLPTKERKYITRGLLYSLGPTIVQLFVVFPYQAHKGIMGLQLGYLTPVFVLFFNAVWGVAAGMWLNIIGYRRPS